MSLGSEAKFREQCLSEPQLSPRYWHFTDNKTRAG
jgi:hypothetical protein